MSQYQDDLLQVELLFDKLEAIQKEFDKKQNLEGNGYANAQFLINNAIAEALCTDTEQLEEIRKAKQEYEAKLDPKINIPVNLRELSQLMSGVILLHQSIVAEQYVKESYGKGVKAEKRWSEIAKIMLIKNDDEPFRKYGDKVFYSYVRYFRSGIKPNEASKMICKEFHFHSQPACDKGLQREIKRMQKEFPDVFGNVKAPSISVQ